MLLVWRTARMEVYPCRSENLILAGPFWFHCTKSKRALRGRAVLDRVLGVHPSAFLLVADEIATTIHGQGDRFQIALSPIPSTRCGGRLIRRGKFTPHPDSAL